MFLEIQPQYPRHGQGVREIGQNLGKADRDLYALNFLVCCLQMDLYKGIYLLFPLNLEKFLPAHFFRGWGCFIGGMEL